jgi:signal transduction histidine kinase
MFNNAIDHSGGTHILVQISKTAASSEMAIADNGVGISKKIQAALGLFRRTTLRVRKKDATI